VDSASHAPNAITNAVETTTKTQRRRAHRKAVDSSVIRLQINDRPGGPHPIDAGVIDVIDGGFGVNLKTPLKTGSIVLVKPAADRSADGLKAQVRWCVAKPGGTFRAGLEFLDGRSTFTLDCYEVMQLSPHADPETISRVYRILASRYHPDNQETGSSEMFLRIREAYQVLSDPQKRASYDARQREAVHLHSKIFDPAPVSKGTHKERRKRLDRATHQARRKEDRLPPSVGALHGWNAALRHPSF
jgi:DnaJ domain/PilZ domain